jgi:hypothetical protein
METFEEKAKRLKEYGKEHPDLVLRHIKSGKAIDIIKSAYSVSSSEVLRLFSQRGIYFNKKPLDDINIELKNGTLRVGKREPFWVE